MALAARLILGIVAALYAWGAAVHVANMLGLTGFDWLAAPLKWQVLDIVYLALDLVVAAGFLIGWRIAVPAFYAAAASQILLYTTGRTWILDVPDAFRRSPEEAAWLDTLIAFHAVTLATVTGALILRRATRRRRQARPEDPAPVPETAVSPQPGQRNRRQPSTAHARSRGQR